ncbi:ribosome maturation factor RimP [Sulfobacillus acidophilus]|uniref:Ribosome maturation factor RimP n=1 Tax=Sulfobacillus acidophilus TaxID=53633 RepID=A0ABS3AWC6_9FIRM|nr:ribosome maturation factor RimP [Sulfobacillus acidophilus]
MENLKIGQSEPFMVPLSSKEQKVVNIALPYLEAEGCELVSVRVLPQKSGSRVCLFIDKKNENNHIDLACLGRLNRLLGDVFSVADDEDKLFLGTYNLEVSSPGLDRPLTKLSHFKKNIGKRINFKTDEMANLPKAFAAKLLDASEIGVKIEYEQEKKSVFDVSWNHIKSAYLIYEFTKKTGKKAKK